MFFSNLQTNDNIDITLVISLMVLNVRVPDPRGKGDWSKGRVVAEKKRINIKQILNIK